MPDVISRRGNRPIFLSAHAFAGREHSIMEIKKQLGRSCMERSLALPLFAIQTSGGDQTTPTSLPATGTDSDDPADAVTQPERRARVNTRGCVA